MNYKYKRNLEINEWLVNTRWFYMTAIFLIGILGNSLISVINNRLTFIYIAILLLLFLIINSCLNKVLIKIKNSELSSEIKLKYLSVWQIIIEIIFFTIILYLIGDKSIAGIFFFLPIISSAFIFGVRGALLTALVSTLILNASNIFEYFNLIFLYIQNKNFLNSLQLLELKYSTIFLIKIIATSNFYFVIAIFSGYGIKFLSKREQKIIKKIEEIKLEKKLQEKKIKKLGDNAKILERHEKIIKNINQRLNKKINELEISEKSLIRAFNDLQQARKATEEEKNKTESIISNFIDPIIVINKNDEIDLINPSAKEIFGFTDNNLGEKVKSDDNYSMKNFQKIIKQKYTVKTSKEVASIDSDNEEEIIIIFKRHEFTYKVITKKIISDNEYKGVLKIFYNLTRERMIDKLKSEFISIAAHQLRTPLSAIKWIIKMVLDGDVGEINIEQQKLLFKGYQSNERMIVLVNNMLNVSRIEEGRFGYSFNKEDIVELIQNEVDNISNLIKNKKIKFIFNKPEKISKIFLDKKKMSLVFQNLLENAIKYTPNFGTITVTIESGNKFIKVKIKDNGVGIPKIDQKKLFSKFFRAQNVIRMQTEGSGLGLFIVKNIIESHNGKILVNSEEGKGSEFILTLPTKK